MSPFYEFLFIERVMEFAGLITKQPPQPAVLTNLSIDVFIEARKCLVNILAKSSKLAHKAFMDLDGPQRCMACLNVRFVKTVNSFRFPFLMNSPRIRI
jgi:hypothetical protein